MLEQKIIDDGLISKNFSYLLKLVIVSAAVGIFSFLLEYLQLQIQAGVAASFRNRLKCESLAHGLRLKMQYLKKHTLLALMTDANIDVNNMSRVCSNDVFGILIEFIKVFGYLVGLLLLSWKLTIIVLLIVPVKILISNIVGRRTKDKMEELLKIQKNISRWQSDNYSGVEEIKNWNLYQHIEGEFQNLSGEREKSDKQIYMLSALDTSLKKTSEKLIFIVIYIFAALQIWNGSLTFGTFIAFIQYAGYLFAPIDVLSGLKMVLGNVLPSVKSHMNFMSMEEEKLTKGEKKIKVPQTILFNNITFSYEEQPILDNFSLELRRGEKTAILGLNGSGKSTLMQLLLRNYQPQKGNVCFDDTDIENYSLKEYRNMFSVMGQNVFLFNTSIENNIDMFRGDSSKAWKNEYKDVLSYVWNFPDKEKTIVGSNGTSLSGGEKQRVALVRSLAKKSEILILDEATSNCDVALEGLFKELLKENKHAFTICITHNYDMIENFDRVILLESGKVKYDGDAKDAFAYLQGVGEFQKKTQSSGKKRLRKRDVSNGYLL